jgi:hypothetical protein
MRGRHQVKYGLGRKGIDRRKAAISGALVAILLVVVAIAFIGIAVAVLSGFIGTGSVKTDIMIEKLDLVANGYSVAVLRNTGNVRITSINATRLVCDQSGTLAQPTFTGPIDPGKTITATWSTTLIPGETCRLTIEATAANGAKVAASASSIVRP